MHLFKIHSVWYISRIFLSIEEDIEKRKKRNKKTKDRRTTLLGSFNQLTWICMILRNGGMGGGE